MFTKQTSVTKDPWSLFVFLLGHYTFETYYSVIPLGPNLKYVHQIHPIHTCNIDCVGATLVLYKVKSKREENLRNIRKYNKEF